MYNEQQELLNEVYKNYLMEDAKILPNMSKEKMTELGYGLTQEEFINKCKTDPEFSEKWGLKIEERELSLEERYTIARQYALCPKYSNIGLESCTIEEHYAKYKVPTKLITITYNDKTIESYG
jgi:hypothetical protein